MWRSCATCTMSSNILSCTDRRMFFAGNLNPVDSSAWADSFERRGAEGGGGTNKVNNSNNYS